MVGHTLKRALGERKIRSQLRERYGGEARDDLVSTLYPLVERVGAEGLEQVLGFSDQLAKYSIKLAVHQLEAAPKLIDLLLAAGDRELILKVYELCRQVARDSIFVAARLLEESPGLIEQLHRHADTDLVKHVYDLSRQLATTSGGTAVRLLELSPELVDRVGYDGLEKIADISSQVAPENSFVAARMLELSPELVDRVGYAGLEKVVGLSIQLARDHRSVAVRMLELSPELVDRVGYAGLEEIAALAHQVARYSWRTAVSLLGMSPALIDRVGRKGLEELAALSSTVARKDSFVAARVLELSPQLVEAVGLACLERIATLSTAVNKDDGFIAAQVLDESPALVERLLTYGDTDLVRSVYTFCCRVAEEYNWRTAVRLLRETPDLFEHLYAHGDRAMVKAVYALCTQVAEHSGITGVSLLEASPGLINRVGYEGFEQLAARATELAQIGEGRATSFVRGESSEYAAFVASIVKGLELKRIKPFLAMYLNALLGYRIELMEASSASTDGERIYLPDLVQEFREEDRNFLLYKVLATHEEAHLEYGSFEFELTTVHDLTGAIRATYGERGSTSGASDLEQFYALFPEPALACDLTTLLEDYRITARLQAEYPVLGEQIAAMNAYMLVKRPPLASLATDKQRAVELVGRILLAGGAREAIPEALEQLLEEIAALSSSVLSSSQADVHETARVAAEVYSLLDEALTGTYQPVQPFSAPLDQSRVEERIGNVGRTARKIREKLEQQELAGAEEKEQPVEKTAVAARSSSEEAVCELLKALFKEKGIKPKEIEQRLDTLEPVNVRDYLGELETLIRDEDELQRERDTFLYHEWGLDIGEYRPNWVRVREHALVGDSTEFYGETKSKYSGLIKCIRREFQMLRPEGLTSLREQYDGQEIDLDAAVQYFIDKRLRLSPSERNYIRTEKRSRDIAVAFLVDVSGSTGGATLACEKEALIVMSEALEELGDAFAIYGFSGYGRDKVIFYTVKEFEELYDDQVQRKISMLASERSTRIAPAIRHTTAKLQRRDEKTKLLILLSDGKPLDIDYHGDYAIEDTRMALREAQRYGVKSFCITVDREAAEYLPRMYANSRWVVIDEVAKLPEKITRIYRLFTT